MLATSLPTLSLLSSMGIVLAAIGFGAAAIFGVVLICRQVAARDDGFKLRSNLWHDEHDGIRANIAAANSLIKPVAFAVAICLAVAALGVGLASYYGTQYTIESKKTVPSELHRSDVNVHSDGTPVGILAGGG